MAKITQYLVTVRADEKPPFMGNEAFYTGLSDLAMEVAKGRGESSGFEADLDSLDVVGTLIADTEESAKEMARKVREMGMYKDVTISPRQIHLDDSSGKVHERYVVTVRGSVSYAMSHPETLVELGGIIAEASNAAKEPIFLNSTLLKPGDGIAELVAPTEKAADEAAKRIRALDRYTVDVTSKGIPVSEITRNIPPELLSD